MEGWMDGCVCVCVCAYIINAHCLNVLTRDVHRPDGPRALCSAGARLWKLWPQQRNLPGTARAAATANTERRMMFLISVVSILQRY